MVGGHPHILEPHLLLLCRMYVSKELPLGVELGLKPSTHLQRG